MGANSVGSVTIDTTLDLDGVEKASQELLQMVEETVSKSNRVFNGFIVHMDGIEDAERDLETLNQRLRDMSETRTRVAQEFDAASKSFGRDSAQANIYREALDKLEQSIRINAQKADGLSDAINQAREAKERASRTTKEYGSAASDAADKTEKLAKEQKQASQLSETMQVALGNLVARGIELAISAVGSLLDEYAELNKQMAILDTNVQNSAISTEAAKEAMKRLNVVTEDTGSQLETVSNLMRAGLDDNQLKRAIDDIAGAVVSFGAETIQAENVAESFQETLATGEAVGQFAELLERCQVPLESFNARMEGMSNQSQRLDYALQTLNSLGLSGVYEGFRSTNQEIVKAADSTFEYNQTLQELSGILQPLKAEALQGFTLVLAQNKDAIKMLADVALELLSAFFQLFEIIGAFPPDVLVFITLLVSTATAAIKIATALDSAMGGLDEFMSVMNLSYLSVAKWVGIIVAATAAVSALLYLILALRDGTEEASQAMGNFNSARSGPRLGYASGTASAGRGWRLVGERGPELVQMSGGERVLTANQTLAMQMMQGWQSPTKQAAGNINITVQGVRQLDEIVSWYNNRRQMERAR